MDAPAAGQGGARLFMGEKINAFITVMMLSVIILIFTAADVTKEDRTFSETENRLLASRPELSWKSLFEGSYTEDYETYVTDQFVGRDKWISLKTYSDVLLLKQEIGGVYLGKDGYLLEQHLPEAYSAETVEKKLSLLEKLVEDWDAAVMLVPTADNILTDKMPANAPFWGQQEFLEQVAERVGQTHYIDVFSALAEHSSEEIYYRTDHHWTSLGAYYGYGAWADFMGVEPYPYDINNMKLAAEDFLGTLHSKVNIEWESDSIYYFRETEEMPVTVTYDLRTTTDSLYEEKYLDTKNKYGFFLDDNHALVEIETGAQTGKSLFVIKDSYANCFIPMLVPHYDTIYLLDLRYYNGRLYDLMKQYAPQPDNDPEGKMDVLVLYNCIHFLEDFVYA